MPLINAITETECVWHDDEQVDPLLIGRQHDSNADATAIELEIDVI